MPRFIKYYRHERCGTAWYDEWSCACDDECPTCGAEIEPYRWTDLSVRVDESPRGWVATIHPRQQNIRRNMRRHSSTQKGEACAFAASEAERKEGHLSLR